MFGSEFLKQWVRELLSTDQFDTGYGLYADNDDCVAKSITSEYW